MPRTGLVFHPLYTNHLTGPDHPERPERVLAVLRRLRQCGLLDHLASLEPSPADLEWIHAVHEADYVDRVRLACEEGRQIMDSGDTAISTGSYQAARLAAGGALQAADHIMAGEWSNAFIACRPPGHHAESHLAMGFCLFNNAAVAARYLQRRHGIGRVAILDWDVHHGNGTQHTFENDPTVYYLSLHQWPLYPGTGLPGERGHGEAEGTNLNCLMSPGDGDDEYLRVMEEQVLPALDAFDPEFLIISAGFDAHAADPLSATQVVEDGYRRMSRLAAGLAADHCSGRILSLLEGGYDLHALAGSVEVHLEEMLAAGQAGTSRKPGT